MNRLKPAKFVTTCFGALALAAALQATATPITFNTAPGSMTGGQPVNATATFTVSAGSISITLTDLQANPTSAVQALSDLEFTLSTGQTTGTLGGSSAHHETVNGDGSVTAGSTGSTGWGLNNNVLGGLQLDALGFVGPAGLLLGPPDGTGVYSNANGSIAGNGPHNPFLDGVASFTVNVTGLLATATITSATFSFGTTEGANLVPGVPGPPPLLTPEPASIALLGIGLLAFGATRRNRKA